MKTLVCFSIMVGIVATLFCAKPVVDQWERANAYPFGRMCDSIFTGFVDTCPASIR